MAGLSQSPKTGMYEIWFRFAGQKFHKSLGERDAVKAEKEKERIEDLIELLKKGRVELPANADLWEYLKTDGRRDQKVHLVERLDLAGLCKWYATSLPEGAKESKTHRVENIHLGHMKRLLGAGTALDAITGQHLQEGYVNKRAQEKWRGRPIKPNTIIKEIQTLQMVWNRAYRNKMDGVNGLCPSQQLKFPKRKRKPPFQTWAEIERAIERGGLSAGEVREMWKCLFLDVEQVKEVLVYVRTKLASPREKAARPYFYPLLVLVAHTGARLSEALRSQVGDIYFDVGRVYLREKKRNQEGYTFRWVELTPMLRDTLRAWLEDDHPGGATLFCEKPNEEIPDQTLHYDRQCVLAGSKWNVIPGFHVFRHSFASNLARKGMDQREIDGRMGHQTEEMRKRYLHLFPQNGRSTVTTLFD